jgi:hypothetical protein
MKVWVVKMRRNGKERLLTGYVSESLASAYAKRCARTAANLGRDPDVAENHGILAPDRKVIEEVTPERTYYTVKKHEDDLDEQGPDGKRVKCWIELVRYWSEPLTIQGDAVSALGAQA